MALDGTRKRAANSPEGAWYNLLHEIIGDLEGQSSFFKANRPEKARPVFSAGEIIAGAVLGQGDFGTVREVEQIIGNDDDETEGQKRRAMLLHTSTNTTETGSTQEDIAEIEYGGEDDIASSFSTDLKLHMRMRCTRGVSRRYAVKRVREDLQAGSTQHYAAMLDLVAESKFLESLTKHPNIIRLRATIGEPGDEDFRLILDRLHLSMREKLARWEMTDKKLCRKGLFGGRPMSDTLSELLVDRLTAAYDIARALRFLHSHKIVYRDLKPDNIGFDVRGDVRLFDFGTARELKEIDLVLPPDNYRLTPETGTPRYMAPEVFSHKPYGLKADVHSFAMVFWQILHFKEPYGDITRPKYTRDVVNGKKRPPIDKFVPKAMRILMKLSWSKEPASRPSIEDVCDELALQIVKTEDSISKNDLLNRSNTMRNGSESSLQEVITSFCESKASDGA